ncbi:MAG: RCC1 repeat- and reductase domain-containing protein [Gammaproteobacteria bacterium]|nr:RCC1 repeat- and reductase domain-containing protein [Gammaproteobacteria bacterium]
MYLSLTTSLNVIFILISFFSHSLYALPISWGKNDNGQLGHNAAGGPVPHAILNSDPFSAIDLGAHASIALKTDGSVWSWGGNWHGELGDGSTTQSTRPVQVVGLNNVIAVSRAAKTDTVAALKADGSVWCWGRNQYGQLGNGTQIDSLTAMQSNISNVIAIATGPADVMALKKDGTVWAWGDNSYWKFGSTSALSAGSVFQVLGISNVVAIASGSYHALYLKADGSVWLSGRMGSVSLKSPTQVANLSRVVEITAGQEYSLARKEDGSVWAWGANYYGNLGDGTTTERLAPVQITGLNQVVDLSANLFHSLAVKTDGTVWSWGSNTAGQLGHRKAQHKTPQQIIGVSKFNAVATGGNHSAAYLAQSALSSLPTPYPLTRRDDEDESDDDDNEEDHDDQQDD